jgi:RNA polymerase sigma-70 factor (ECF subfamily)
MNNKITSFHHLYQSYERDVYRFAYWLCGAPEEAKDISAETFLRLWTANGTIRAQTVKGYLFTIARNIFLQNRQKFKQSSALTDDLLDPTPNAEVAAESSAELQRLIEVLQDLPEIERTVLILKSYEGLSYDEISSMLELSVTTLKVKVHRARQKLIYLRTNGDMKCK